MPEQTKTATRTCRLLYYGPAQVGKRDNLRLIHRSIPPAQRLALASDDPERQIAFEVAHGTGGQWQVLVQAVDSGKERYRTAGMNARPPFDGIVFVVDSSAASLDQSLAAFESLKAYLESWGRDLMGVPLVIQYNGRDRADTLRVDRLESLLNPWGLLSFPANAKQGEGVRETLKALLGLVVNHLENESGQTDDDGHYFAEPEPQTDVRPVAAAKPETVQGDEGLAIDYGPPLPGTEVAEATRTLSDAIYEELRAPIVIPVRIPRHLLEGRRPLRILLEVEVEESRR